MEKKIVRTILCVLCAVLLCSYSVFTPVAEALTATMSLSLAVTALAVLIISSIGVTITAPSGQDVTDYVGESFQSWVASKGYTDVGSWFSAATGINITSYIAHVFSGVLAVGKIAYDAIKSFVEYFIDAKGIEAGGEAVGQVPVAPSISLPAGCSFDWIDSSRASVSMAYNFTAGNYGSLTIGLTGSFLSGTVVSISQSTSLPSMFLGGRYDSSNYISSLYYKRPYSRVGGVTEQAINRTSVTLPRDLVYISLGVTNANTSGGNYYYQSASGTYAFTLTFSAPVVESGGAVFAPDTNILDLPTLTDDESYGIGSDVITGTMSTTAALAAVTNLASTAEGIQTSAAVRDDPVNPPSTGPVSGLQSFFPFCLPFDFARFIGILSATREAPAFDWIIPIPSATGLSIGDQYIHIDLSDFDPAAEVLRTAELLASAIGLILLTRELLKW